jgi:hypothetical protein
MITAAQIPQEGVSDGSKTAPHTPEIDPCK